MITSSHIHKLRCPPAQDSSLYYLPDTAGCRAESRPCHLEQMPSASHYSLSPPHMAQRDLLTTLSKVYTPHNDTILLAHLRPRHTGTSKFSSLTPQSIRSLAHTAAWRRSYQQATLSFCNREPAVWEAKQKNWIPCLLTPS